MTSQIRQAEGFKNVSLGNVLQAQYSVMGNKPVTFLAETDQDIFKRLKGEAFEVQVRASPRCPSHSPGPTSPHLLPWCLAKLRLRWVLSQHLGSAL